MSKVRKHFISFRVNGNYSRTIEELSNKLGLDRSKTIRFALDKLIEKYLKLKSNLVVIEREKWVRKPYTDTI